MNQQLKVAGRAQVPPFGVMRILARVTELRSAGRDVISLCAGEPGSGAPAAVSAAAARIHAEARPLTYTPALGITELRAAIAGHYQRWYGIEVPVRNVAVTTGSSGAFMLGFLAAFNPGDRVALARPGYPAYRNILRALGVDVVEIDCGPETRYQPTPGQLAAASREHGPLAGLILASPANPTGTMVTRAEFEALTRWCAENAVRLVSDEIYHGITYPAPGAEDARGVCAWELGRDSMVISSFSKYWGMTGWRLGWALVPNDLIDAVDALAGNVALCPPAPAQYAALAAFDEESYAQADREVEAFAATREALLANLGRLGWGAAAPADGAFYFYAELGGALGSFADAGEYCAALLEEEGVALVPGADFDSAAGRKAVRLSFAAGHEAVLGAIERIIRFQSKVR
ncbi:aminotransferase class I/II-fold pyridoxal phosphate-dependent enzyme [Paeniglutamicibacter cryotolerans]|uniref:Aminotransferase n=1 Tax=Paeniglutamicibacter cryotolerans TaxID=670079 RepID=A0A839QF88_9MICC|nr:aminotransferase class I/II-fold pyridoxal phosphate-dependent enzyme [Paeniglutamicibacter cryotolerans]MBB2994809.1 aspartate/methionine/tyrosine aminotransferase [Paeniglutamicibacter cryotolerans]